MVNGIDKNFQSASAGFGMVQLVVVLGVASALMSGMIAIILPGAEEKTNRAGVTAERLVNISEAIQTYRIQYDRLPCPASFLTRNDNTNIDASTPTAIYGSEDLNLDQTDGNVGIDCPSNIGMVPFRSLSLSEDNAYDGWNSRILYAVSSNLCGIGASATAVNDGCTPFNYENGTPDLVVTDGTSNITTEAAYVLVSHGEDGLGSFAPSGNQRPVSTDTDEAENTDSDVTFVKRDRSGDYDDIVMYRTRDFIENNATDVVTDVVTVDECVANSNFIEAFTATEAGEIDTNVTYFDPNYDGSVVILQILWALQSICEARYGADGQNDATWTAVGIQCPGGTTSGGTYNPGSEECTCASGLWDDNC